MRRRGKQGIEGEAATLDEFVTIDLTDLVGHDPDQQRYSAWADRLRDKRARDKATILGGPDDGCPPLGYWSADSVLTDDDAVDEPGVVPDRMRRSRLLDELGLEPTATAQDAALAYRRLAKLHHPDRWVEADGPTQANHAEEMLRLNAVYRALRTQA